MKQGKLKMIISPAKKMKEKEILAATGQPRYLEETKKLLAVMQTMSEKELQTLWKCNDAIAEENYRRIQQMNLQHAYTPAILAYEGIQYKYMAPAVFEEKAYAYLQEHLYILSGFYGALKPVTGEKKLPPLYWRREAAWSTWRPESTAKPFCLTCRKGCPV